jgi:hypothetical protein
MKPVSAQIDPKYVAQTRKLDQYTQLLRNILPVECYSHVKVANIRRQMLMLITDSPVWTTRIRQLAPQILSYVNENRPSEMTPSIHHIQVNTRYQKNNTVNDNNAGKTRRHKPVISKNTSEMLVQSARTISHEGLRKALLKIAHHSERDASKSQNKEP